MRRPLMILLVALLATAVVLFALDVLPRVLEVATGVGCLFVADRASIPFSRSAWISLTVIGVAFLCSLWLPVQLALSVLLALWIDRRLNRSLRVTGQ